MEDLVEDAERVEPARANGRRSARVAGCARCVDPCREPSRACDVGDEDAPAQPEQRPRQVVTLAGRSGDVELPHGPKDVTRAGEPPRSWLRERGRWSGATARARRDRTRTSMDGCDRAGRSAPRVPRRALRAT